MRADAGFARAFTILVALVAPLNAVSSEALREPKPIRCDVAEPLATAEAPRGITADPAMKPSDASYAEVFEFVALPSDLPGSAILIRLIDQQSGDTALRGDPRSWGLSITFGQSVAVATAFGYQDPSKPDEYWVYDASDLSARSQYSHFSSTPSDTQASSVDRICRSLGLISFSSHVRITGVSSGRASTGTLHRLLQPIRNPYTQ